MSDSITIAPVEASDLPHLGADLLLPQKLALIINRLLFRDWPNETTQKAIYTGAVESAFNNPSVECLKAVDEKGDIVGYLALTRKQPAKAEPPSDTVDAENTKGKQDPPEFVDPAVFSAVQAAVSEINQETQNTEHFGTTIFHLFLPFHHTYTTNST